jgi:hypothetical protein
VVEITEKNFEETIIASLQVGVPDTPLTGNNLILELGGCKIRIAKK